eukprot:Pgem_evm1s12028
MFSVFAVATFALAATTAINASSISQEDSLAKCNKQFDMVVEKKRCFFFSTDEGKKECLLTQMKLDKKCISYVESLGRLAELEPPLQKCLAELREKEHDELNISISDTRFLLQLNLTSNCVDILVDFFRCNQQFVKIVEEEKKCFFEDDEKKRQCLKQMGLVDTCISDLQAIGGFESLEPAKLKD